MGRFSLRQTSKGTGKTQRGFTLIELLVILVSVLFLASIGLFAYQNAIAHAKDTVCKTNLDALREAIDLYLSENDALPASLGHLKLEHLQKGYAKAMEDGRWLKKLAYFLIKLDASDQAYAQFLTYENLQKYGVTEEIFHCPADRNGGTSYGINGNLTGKAWESIAGDAVVVADCDIHVFTSVDQLSKRHKHKAIVATKDRDIVEFHEETTKNEKPLRVKEVKAEKLSPKPAPHFLEPTPTPAPEVAAPAPEPEPYVRDDDNDDDHPIDRDGGVDDGDLGTRNDDDDHDDYGGGGSGHDDNDDRNVSKWWWPWWKR
jgi:type II secretory pathway pseudopilin PulG